MRKSKDFDNVIDALEQCTSILKGNYKQEISTADLKTAIKYFRCANLEFAAQMQKYNKGK